VAWVKIGNLKGTTGGRGAPGVKGTTGHKGATGGKGVRGGGGPTGDRGATPAWSKTHTDGRYRPKVHTHKAEEVSGGKFGGTSYGFHNDVYMAAWGTAGYMHVTNIPAGGGGTRLYWHAPGGSASNTLIKKASARRYKENIEDVDAAPIIAALRGLRIRRFRFDETVAGYGDTVVEGVIAEEAVEHMPDLVQYMDGKVDGFAYGELIMPTVVGMQDLIERVEQLEVR